MEWADTMEELMHLLEETPRGAASLTFFALKAFSGIVEKSIFKSIYKHHPERLNSLRTQHFSLSTFTSLSVSLYFLAVI